MREGNSLYTCSYMASHEDRSIYHAILNETFNKVDKIGNALYNHLKIKVTTPFASQLRYGSWNDNLHDILVPTR
jgi:hypothetical protein